MLTISLHPSSDPPLWILDPLGHPQVCPTPSIIQVTFLPPPVTSSSLPNFSHTLVASTICLGLPSPNQPAPSHSPSPCVFETSFLVLLGTPSNRIPGLPPDTRINTLGIPYRADPNPTFSLFNQNPTLNLFGPDWELNGPEV